MEEDESIILFISSLIFSVPSVFCQFFFQVHSVGDVFDVHFGIHQNSGGETNNKCDNNIQGHCFR